MVLYPNKLPESERVCSGICKLSITADTLEFINTGKREETTSEAGSPTDATSDVPVPPVAMPQENKEDLPF